MKRNASYESCYAGPVSDTVSLFCVNEIQLESFFTLFCSWKPACIFFSSAVKFVSAWINFPMLKSLVRSALKWKKKINKSATSALTQDYRSLRRVSQDFSQHSGWMDEQMKSEWRWSVFGITHMKRLWWSDYRGKRSALFSNGSAQAERQCKWNIKEHQ